jgi:hypothetical protein
MIAILSRDCLDRKRTLGSTIVEEDFNRNEVSSHASYSQSYSSDRPVGSTAPRAVHFPLGDSSVSPRQQAILKKS